MSTNAKILIAMFALATLVGVYVGWSLALITSPNC